MDRVSSAELSAIQELVTHGAVQIPLRITHLVPGAIRGFNAFLEKPYEYRRGWDLWIEDERRRDVQDIGYKDKGAEPGEDAKHIFHWTVQLERLLIEERGVDINDHADFLGYARSIFTICYREFRYIAEALDYVMPEGRFLERASDPAAKRQSILRFVRYKDVNRDVIGKGHTDKNLISLHLADSHPGLRLEKHGQLYATSPDVALVFPGDKMDVITNGRIKALYHYVTDQRKPGDKTLRWVMVFFGHVPL